MRPLQHHGQCPVLRHEVWQREKPEVDDLHARSTSCSSQPDSGMIVKQDVQEHVRGRRGAMLPVRASADAAAADGAHATASRAHVTRNTVMPIHLCHMYHCSLRGESGSGTIDTPSVRLATTSDDGQPVQRDRHAAVSCIDEARDHPGAARATCRARRRTTARPRGAFRPRAPSARAPSGARTRAPPRSPSQRCSRSASASTTVVAAIAAVSATSQVPIVAGSRDAISMTVASADGPAIDGIASGTRNGSAPGGSPKMPSGRGNTIRIAIRNRMIPPAIVERFLGQVQPLQERPAAQHERDQDRRRPRRTRAARRGTRRSARRSCSAATTSGTLPNGSMTSISRIVAEKSSAFMGRMIRAAGRPRSTFARPAFLAMG